MKINLWDSPGSLAVKTLHFTAGYHGFNPWSGTKIPHTAQHSPPKKKMNL